MEAQRSTEKERNWQNKREREGREKERKKEWKGGGGEEKKKERKSECVKERERERVREKRTIEWVIIMKWIERYETYQSFHKKGGNTQSYTIRSRTIWKLACNVGCAI